MRRNPEFTEEEARDYIKQNLAEFNETFSISNQVVIQKEEEDEQEEQEEEV